jgi:hypothetical protein
MPELPPIRALQETSLESLTLIRDEIDGLFSRYGTEPLMITGTLKNLFWYLSSRSQTVSFLISYGYSWDAEIILRSFYEAAAKIVFICFADEAEKLNLINEFWHELGPIGDRKSAHKAKFAEQIQKKESVSASIFAMLQDSRVFDFVVDGSKAERKRLEQKWSFSEIIESLERQATQGIPLKGIKSLLHIYGMASHLIHADKHAMDLMHDRATRPIEELKTLEASHAARIMTDQVSITWLCADALRRHFNGEFSNAATFREAFNRTAELSKPFQTAFEDSQKEFYSHWLANDVSN